MRRFLAFSIAVISLLTIIALAFFSSPLIAACLLEGLGIIYLICYIKLKLNSFATATAATGFSSDLENENLGQSQKMAIIGQLAGGIAHDFNNLLMVILSSCELILMDIDPESDDTLNQRIQSIMTSGQQAATLTAQLLSFSKKAIVEPKQTNINEVIVKYESALRRLVGKDIILHCTMAEHLNLIMIDGNQINQILFSLSANARDAMTKGGSLMIETENVSIDDIEFVKLTISDTGCGMTNEIKSRMYEPFFTTKEKSLRQGLGLSTTYGITEQNGGYIEVESKINQGTTFALFFPICSKHEEDFCVRQRSPQVRRRQARLARCGTETILVAEDQDDVRNLVSQVLLDRGYHVISASNGLEGRNLALQQEKIDLLLTDVVMANMNGRQLSEQIIKYFPQIKIIFMTGYTDDEVLHRGVKCADYLVLQKPFSPLILLKSVRKLLDDSITKPESADDLCDACDYGPCK